MSNPMYNPFCVYFVEDESTEELPNDPYTFVKSFATYAEAEAYVRCQRYVNEYVIMEAEA